MFLDTKSPSLIPENSTFVIIGAGTAAHAACRTIRRNQPDAKVVGVCQHALFKGCCSEPKHYAVRPFEEAFVMPSANTIFFFIIGSYFYLNSDLNCVKVLSTV